jgi:hypothetical protein
LTVAQGTGISLVGGNITVQDGATLTAPQGTIALVSVGKPSNPHVAGEVVISGSGPGTGYTPTGFKSLGTIELSQGSTLNASIHVGGPVSSTNSTPTVLIRAGQFVMDDAHIGAGVSTSSQTGIPGGIIDVTAEQVTLSNHSTVDVSGFGGAGLFRPLPGRITFNVGTFSATDSALRAEGGESTAGGAVTIQGLNGAGTFARSVFLLNTEVSTRTFGGGNRTSGPIFIGADKIVLKQSTLETDAENAAGTITLVSNGSLDIQNSRLLTFGIVGGFGGTVNLQGGKDIILTNTEIRVTGSSQAGSVTMAAPTISLDASTVAGGTPGGGGDVPGMISLTATKAVSLTNGSILSETPGLFGAGSIQINGGAQFASQHSTISALAGTIQLRASKVTLTDSQVTTSARPSISPLENGGTITVDAKNLTLNNSQILSTATNGHGGTIDITTKALHQDANSVIDASSQFGTNGTVTINGVVQP